MSYSIKVETKVQQNNFVIVIKLINMTAISSKFTFLFCVLSLVLGVAYGSGTKNTLNMYTTHNIVVPGVPGDSYFGPGWNFNATTGAPISTPGGTFISRLKAYPDSARQASPFGTQTVSCVQTIDIATEYCVATLTYANGRGSITIAGEFIVGPQQLNKLAIVGGTGDFVGVSGQANIVVTPSFQGNPLVNYYAYQFVTEDKYWN
jgi:hypothetical protein